MVCYKRLYHLKLSTAVHFECVVTDGSEIKISKLWFAYNSCFIKTCSVVAKERRQGHSFSQTKIKTTPHKFSKYNKLKDSLI